MILVIGGAFQGKTEYVRTHFLTAEDFICNQYHEKMREWLLRGKEAGELTKQVIEAYAEGIIIANEVGCGVVPLEVEERAYREAVGRSLCEIAKEAEQVFRVQCGIAKRIK